MVEKIVSVEVEGGAPFRAKVRLDVDSLDPKHMPDRLSGVFTELPSAKADSLLANLGLHSDRTGGGSSHIIFFGGGRDGYKFTMNSDKALDFTAVHQGINPKTGRRGFKRKAE